MRHSHSRPPQSPSRPGLSGFLGVLLLLAVAGGLQAAPLPYWDLAPLDEPGQLTLFNSDSLDALNGVPVRAVDLTGDGRAEVVMSGIRGDGHQQGPFRDSAGEIHIVFWGGAPLAGYLDFRRPDPRVLEILGPQPFDYLGICLTHGDLNADGIDDLAVGAFGADGPGRDGAGRFYILFGDSALAGGGTIDLADGLPANMATVLGSDADDRLGVWGGIGDIDGDGFGDLVMGADRSDGPGDTRPNAGKAIILYGPILPGEEIDLATTNRRFSVVWGVDEEDHFGATVACGDWDGDGFADAAIAAASHGLSRNVFDKGGSGDGPPGSYREDSGETWIVFGEGSLPDTLDLASPPDSVSTSVIYGRHPFARAGEELYCADVNGDDVDDLLVGSLSANGPIHDYRLNAGEGYVFYGTPALRDTVILLSSLEYPMLRVYGVRNSIATDSYTAGDVNGDGYDDILVGMPHDPGPEGRNAGTLAVVYGGPALPLEIDLKDPAVPVTLLEGADPDDDTAYWSNCGDVDGDGYWDVIANAMTGAGWRNSRPIAGDARVVSGAFLTLHPAPPESVQVLDNSPETGVLLGWAPAADPAVTGYRVTWGTDEYAPTSSLDVPASSQPRLWIGELPARQRCYFRVSALRGTLSSRASAPVVSTPGGFPAPVSVTAQVLDENQVVLTWEGVDEPRLLGYSVYRRLEEEDPEEAVRITDSILGGTTFTDTAAPSFEGVVYTVTSLSDEIRESDPSPGVRVWPRPSEAGLGILVVNDYDWSKYSDGPFGGFVGDPWEMYDARAVSGGLPFEFWDMRTGFSAYPPGYSPLGTGELDPAVLFDHGVLVIASAGPTGSFDERLWELEETLLQYHEAGGAVVYLGWLLGSYLTPGLVELFHVADWDRPRTVTATRTLLAQVPGLPDSLGAPPGVTAPSCDVLELEGNPLVRVLYRLDDIGAPPMALALMDADSVDCGYLISAPPSYLDSARLKETMEFLLSSLPGANAETGIDPGVTLTPPPLSLAYPNPSRGAVQVDFRLPQSGRVKATVVDVQGRVVRVLVDDLLPDGDHRLAWDGKGDGGRDAPAGVYFLHVRAPEFGAARRVLLVR